MIIINSNLNLTSQHMESPKSHIPHNIVDLREGGQYDDEQSVNYEEMMMAGAGNGGAHHHQETESERQMKMPPHNQFKKRNTQKEQSMRPPQYQQDYMYGGNRAPGVMPSLKQFRQESPYKNYQDKRTISNQQTPLQSQYNTLVYEREGQRPNQALSSIGFKSQGKTTQPQFQTIPGAAPQKLYHNQGSSHSLHVSQPVQTNNVCHSCSVNMRHLNYSNGHTILYSQNVPVIIQASEGQLAQNSKYLRFEIEILNHQGQSKYSTFGGTNQRLAEGNLKPTPSQDFLSLSISDDANPQFLFLTQIDLQTFLRLRNEQNIFVEFSAFPEKIEALLDFCIANEDPDQQESVNRFLCVMKKNSDGNAIVDIFEHNEFRNLLHLRLDFKKATFEESSQWLSQKLLMQRRVNIDQQQDNYELSEQHESNTAKINTIKQSLIALRQTNNQELERIKEEHMRQLEQAQELKDREIEEQKLSFQEQLSELQTELNSTIDDFRQQTTDLKTQIQQQQSDLRSREEALETREQTIQELKEQLEELKEERRQLQQASEDQKKKQGKLEKNLLEKSLQKENTQKDLQREETINEQLRAQIAQLEEQIQIGNSQSESLKEQVIIAGEQIKSLESELERNINTLHYQSDKISSLKDKRKEQKTEIRSLCDDKLELEVQRSNLDKDLNETQAKYAKLQKERDAQEQLIDRLEFKLREDQQTLLSNKSLIEYLNKSLNEAQKYSFKTLVNQKGVVAEIPASQQIRQSNVSPLRTSIPHAAPKFDQSRILFKDTIEVGVSNLGSKQATPLGLTATPNQLHNVNLSMNHARTESLNDIMNYKPSQNAQLTLPMTDYYSNKHGLGNGVANFNRPMTAANTYNASGNKHFNHGLNNPFSSQLERERIISEERLKQRFDEGYQSRYQGNNNNQGAIQLNPVFHNLQGVPSAGDISRVTLPQAQKHAIMEEDQEGYLNRRASSAVFNPADATNTDLNQYADAKPTDSKRNIIMSYQPAHQMMGGGAPDDDSEEEMESENEDNGEN